MRTFAVALTLFAAACGSSSNTPQDAAPADQKMDDPQLPPMGQQFIDPWLQAGYYKSWHCEPAPRAARSPSPHGTARVCDNDAISTFTGTGEFPVGAASVKEVYENGSLAGYTVYRKLEAGGCDKLYYYERVGSSTPYTDMVGTRVCAGCHGMAAPPNGHDCVYTIVQ